MLIQLHSRKASAKAYDCILESYLEILTQSILKCAVYRPGLPLLKAFCSLWVISEGKFHHNLDFWLLTGAGNRAVSLLQCIPGPWAQQKSQGIQWPRHKAAFCPAAQPRWWSASSYCRDSPAHSAQLPGKLCPGTEAAACPTAFPKGQKSWTPALTHHHLQTQLHGLLGLQLLNQGLAPYFDYSGISSFVKTFVKKR